MWTIILITRVAFSSYMWPDFIWKRNKRKTLAYCVWKTTRDCPVSCEDWNVVWNILPQDSCELFQGHRTFLAVPWRRARILRALQFAKDCKNFFSARWRNKPHVTGIYNGQNPLVRRQHNLENTVASQYPRYVPWFDSQPDKEIFLFFISSRPTGRPIQPPI
jgi:hypothetical protein